MCYLFVRSNWRSEKRKEWNIYVVAYGNWLVSGSINYTVISRLSGFCRPTSLPGIHLFRMQRGSKLFHVISLGMRFFIVFWSYHFLFCHWMFFLTIAANSALEFWVGITYETLFFEIPAKILIFMGHSEA